MITRYETCWTAVHYREKQYHKKAWWIVFTMITLCYDYVITECKIQMDTSEGQKLILQFISVASRESPIACILQPIWTMVRTQYFARFHFWLSIKPAVVYFLWFHNHYKCAINTWSTISRPQKSTLNEDLRLEQKTPLMSDMGQLSHPKWGWLSCLHDFYTLNQDCFNIS